MTSVYDVSQIANDQRPKLMATGQRLYKHLQGRPLLVRHYFSHYWAEEFYLLLGEAQHFTPLAHHNPLKKLLVDLALSMDLSPFNGDEMAEAYAMMLWQSDLQMICLYGG